VKKSFKERHKLLQLELQNKVSPKVDGSQVTDEKTGATCKDSKSKNNLTFSKSDTRVESKKEEQQSGPSAYSTVSQRQAAISISAEGLQLLNNLHKQVP
jgi:hypothetical protein